MTRANVVILVSVLVGLPVLAVGGFVAWLLLSGTPVLDEWACSEGEAPYTYPEGGSACAREGSALPAGATWDPFGNRPLACHDRWGWTEVEPVTPDPDRGTDCVREGEPIPAGWRQVS
jgi:hypothetical protein